MTKSNTSAQRDHNAPIRDRLLGVDDVCEYLGLSRDFVYDQVRLGWLRGSRIARQLRFPRADLDPFVDSHMIETTRQVPAPVRLPRRQR